jgi:hypothetical protein
MVGNEEAIVKREEKRHREKEATCVTFMNLTKHKTWRPRTKLLTEEKRIRFADLSIMNPAKRVWFEKKRPIIFQRDA